MFSLFTSNGGDLNCIGRAVKTSPNFKKYMKNLKKLTKIITDEIPEILELKFGCAIILNNNPFDEQIISELEFYHNVKDKKQIVTDIKNTEKLKGTTGLWVKTNTIGDWIDKAWFKIIGRPITLADVLIVMNKTRTKNGSKDHYVVNPNGLFLENEVKEITARPYKYRMLSTGYNWDLKHNNLNNQSQETIDFLYNILK